MKLADSVRPASGTEHIISHYWEIKKLEKGLISDFHGKKVGVATLISIMIYKELVAKNSIKFHNENLDWNDIYNTYGVNFADDVKKLNSPTVTEETTVEKVKNNWAKICSIVNEELLDYNELLEIMKKAGAATVCADIDVCQKLAKEGVLYHPYMRYRMTLMRLIPMTDFNLKEILKSITI